MTEAMKLYERFNSVMDGDLSVRTLFVHQFPPMQETLQRWGREEGFTADEWFQEIGFEAASDKQIGNMIPVNSFLCPLFEEKILSVNGDNKTMMNAWGGKWIVRMDSASQSAPHYLNWPVKDTASWEAIEDRFDPDTIERFPQDWEDQRKQLNESPFPNFVGGCPCGFYGALRELLGVVELSTSFYDQPDLIKRILSKLTDLWISLWCRIIREIRVEFVFIWEDMCYRNGPLVSPAIVEEFMIPCYRRLIASVKDAGVRHVFVDTDGNCEKLIPLFLSSGVTGMLPFEINSGMDLLAIRKAYPDIGIMGGIDKMAFSKGTKAVDAELKKVEEMLKYGRFIPSLDHVVPPDVSFPQFKEYCLRLRDIIYSC